MFNQHYKHKNIKLKHTKMLKQLSSVLLATVLIARFGELAHNGVGKENEERLSDECVAVTLCAYRRNWNWELLA